MCIHPETSNADCPAPSAYGDSIVGAESRSVWLVRGRANEMSDTVVHGADGESFIAAYLIVVNSLTETLLTEVATACGAVMNWSDGERRQEVRAAVWTMIRVALAASPLSSRQQRLVQDVLSRRLRSRW